MIAPKIVSYVTPTGRDYSNTTSPDLITEVPSAAGLEAIPDDGIDPAVLVAQWNAAYIRDLLGAS